MKINKFNVVKLKDNNKAIILSVDNKKQYLAEIVDKQGKTIDKKKLQKMKLKRLFIIRKKDKSWVLAVCEYPLFIVQNYFMWV